MIGHLLKRAFLWTSLVDALAGMADIAGTQAGDRPLAAPIVVSAQILCIEDGEFPVAVFLCETNGLPVFVAPGIVGQLAVGDLVDAELRRNPHDDFELKSFRKKGNTPLPAPVEAELVRLPELQYRPISLRGVVRSVQKDITNRAWTWMTLRTATGDLPVAAQEQYFATDRLRSLLDAEVKFTGYVRPMCTWRTGLGFCLCLIGGYGQETVADPPAFDAAPPFAKAPLPHRQRLSGTVVAVARERFFIQTDARTGLCCEVYPSDAAATPVEIGDSVTAVGFFNPSIEDYVITEALVRIDGKGRPSDTLPTDIGFDDLFKNVRGNEIISTRFYRRRIRITGTAKGLFDDPGGRRTLILGNANRTLRVDLSSLSGGECPDIRIGSVLQATGLCQADFSPVRTGVRPFEFASFTLLPHRTDDLRVLSSPPRLGSRLLLTIIGVLLATLVGVVIWNRSLATLSERRGEILSKERLALVAARLKIDERTRLAVELHDALSQNLVSAALQLDAVRRFADGNREKMSRHLEIAMRTLKSCRTELRNCLWDLRNRTLEEKDMNTAISRTVSPFVGEAKLHIRFNVPRTQISDDTAHALMRIIRELASNAVRHGKATSIRIAGAIEGGQLLFSVGDNGIGFDPLNHPGVGEGHFGLEGIRERIGRLGGKMKISSAARSTTVAISIKA